MEGRVFENFQKNQKIFKIPKMPKFDPKSVQTCFEDVLGWFFRKKFLPSVPWRVESSKIFKKIKKVSKFQKCPKSSPKVSKRKFSKKIKKSFKIQKMPKIVPKSVQTCFEHVLGYFFEKVFCPVFHGGSSLRKFSKKSKTFQNSKNAQNRRSQKKSPNVQTCFEHVLGWFSRKKFLPSVPWRVESSEFCKKNQKIFKKKMPKIVPKSVQTKIFKKIKKVSKFQKCPKSFPKVSKRVLKMF